MEYETSFFPSFFILKERKEEEVLPRNPPKAIKSPQEVVYLSRLIYGEKKTLNKISLQTLDSTGENKRGKEALKRTRSQKKVWQFNVMASQKVMAKDYGILIFLSVSPLSLSLSLSLSPSLLQFVHRLCLLKVSYEYLFVCAYLYRRRNTTAAL